MFEGDAAYYTRPAEAELRSARDATRPAAAKAYYGLADAYLERIRRAKPARIGDHG